MGLYMLFIALYYWKLCFINYVVVFFRKKEEEDLIYNIRRIRMTSVVCYVLYIIRIHFISSR